MRRIAILSVLLWMFILLAGTNSIFAEEQSALSFNKDTDYEITVELAQGLVAKIGKAHIIGVTEINNKPFLVVLPQSLAKAENAFISLDSVKTILPASGINVTLINSNK